MCWAKRERPCIFPAIENTFPAVSTKMVKGPAPSNGMRVAIVGSGPAGLTIGSILARYGYQVTIFEGKDKIAACCATVIRISACLRTVLDDFEDPPSHPKGNPCAAQHHHRQRHRHR